MLQLENVGLRHGTGVETLSNIDLSLGRGEIAVIAGPPGAGKSSLLALAALAIRPSRGHVRLFGLATETVGRARLPDLRRRIGFVGEALPLLPGLSIRENVALPLRILGTAAAAEGCERIEELLDALGLRARAEEWPAALASGERRRAEIARAMAGRPALILADEPMPEVDAADERRLLGFFERHGDDGAAILIASSDPGLAARVPGARPFRLEHGRLIAAQPPRRALRS